MATVNFLQATNMASLPSSSPATVQTLARADGEMDMETTSQGSILCLGSFEIVDGNVDGVITEAQIDSSDFGSFPNFQITGFDYQLTNSFYNDALINGDSFDFVSSLLAGSDTIIGGAGADALFGGSGVNTASYATAVAGLFAGLEDANANTGDGAGDTYDSIQNLVGSAFNDVLYGSSGANRPSGGGGNDVLVGKGGADVFDGGAGIDEVSYDASNGVLADLQNPSVTPALPLARRISRSKISPAAVSMIGFLATTMPTSSAATTLLPWPAVTTNSTAGAVTIH
jgi:hypothetical protein